MAFLLFPGRHLVNTKFQEDYLRSILGRVPSAIKGVIAGRVLPATALDSVVFTITSANMENSRFNPIPFFVRAIGVDRFARALQDGTSCTYRIFGIPHYQATTQFASFTIKEIYEQSDRALHLTPENCVVLCSTPEVVALYKDLGFSIAPAELAVDTTQRVTPIEIVQAIGAAGDKWSAAPVVQNNLASTTYRLFTDFPEIPHRVALIYRDPLTTQEGGLTRTRDYNPYARGMNEIVKIKYGDIRTAIKAGRIVDEGCADGALLAEISREFRDSDLFGVDLSAEFAHRFQERQRAGDFGGAYVHFLHRNLLDELFEPDSIDTTICNSTLHELWSYAKQEATVLDYLKKKYRQLRPGGRLIIRDVVGPEECSRQVFLHCRHDDGTILSIEAIREHPDRSNDWLRGLSTYSRFLVFAIDYLAARSPSRGRHVSYQEVAHDGLRGFVLDLKTAAEFLSKKDYTDNWVSEMNEEFCFWSFSQWKEILGQAGFLVLENPNQSTTGSRVYTNPWIVENRYRGHAEVFAPNDKQLDPLPFPPTNMVLVAEKPVSRN